MDRKQKLTLALAAALAAITPAREARATPPSGFTATTSSKGTFEPFRVVNRLPHGSRGAPSEDDWGAWLSLQLTTGPSDVYVQSNLWQPGGTTGWHTHPGHSLIIVTEGTITAYDGSCTRREYTAGMTLVDEGGDHVHVLRNEGVTPARTVAIQVVPAGATRRVDAEAPPGCPL